MTIPKKNITCPRCKQENTWRTDNPFRPFCSERCKMIDLGEWAAEKHRVAGEPINPENLDKPEDED